MSVRVLKRVNVFSVFKSIASRAVKCSPAPQHPQPVTLVTSVLFSALQAPQISCRWYSPRWQIPLSSKFLQTTPVAFDLVSTSASVSGCPRIPANALKPEPAVSSSPWLQNQELNDTKKQKNWEREGGEAAVGVGQVWNWFCASAHQGSSGVYVTPEKESSSGKKKKLLPSLSSLFFFPSRFSSSAAWMTAACSFLPTHSCKLAALHPCFQVNEPRRSGPRVWEPGWDLSLTPWGCCSSLSLSASVPLSDPAVTTERLKMVSVSL